MTELRAKARASRKAKNTPIRWEYLVLDGYLDSKEKVWKYQGVTKDGEELEFRDQEQMANELGQQGWELTSVVGHVGMERPSHSDRFYSATTAYYFYFKRPSEG